MEKNIGEWGVEFQVTGASALFTDILTKVGGERCTYMIPTYEALKGILQSIYWKPTIVWIIDKVRVVNQIRTVRRGVRPIKYNDGSNDLAYYTYLDDVCYQVKAHFEWNLNRPELECDRDAGKHLSIARRMIERGGRRDIFLGTRECQGYVEPCPGRFEDCKGFYDGTGEIPYSLMYHGITYADEAELPEDKGFLTVRFWNPVMKDGVIEFIPPKECTIKRRIKPQAIKPFGKELENFSGLSEEGLSVIFGGEPNELGE